MISAIIFLPYLMISFTATPKLLHWGPQYHAVLRYATADYSTHFRVSQARFATETHSLIVSFSRCFRASLAKLTISPYCQYCIMPTKAECVTDRQIDFLLPSLVRDVIQVAFRIRGLIVDRRWHDSLPHYMHTEDRFQRAGCTHHVSCHGFGRGNRNFIGLLAKRSFNGTCL